MKHGSEAGIAEKLGIESEIEIVSFPEIILNHRYSQTECQGIISRLEKKLLSEGWKEADFRPIHQTLHSARPGEGCFFSTQGMSEGETLVLVLKVGTSIDGVGERVTIGIPGGYKDKLKEPGS
jgi:hypothetical protein